MKIIIKKYKNTLEVIEQGPDGIRPGLIEEDEIYSRDWYLRHLFFLLGKFVILIGAANFGENPSLVIPGFIANTNEVGTGFNIDEYVPEFFKEIQVEVIRQLLNENNDLAQSGFLLTQTLAHNGQAGGKTKRRKRRRKRRRKQKTKGKTRRRRRKKRRTRTRRRKHK